MEGIFVAVATAEGIFDPTIMTTADGSSPTMSTYYGWDLIYDGHDNDNNNRS